MKKRRPWAIPIVAAVLLGGLGLAASQSQSGRTPVSSPGSEAARAQPNPPRGVQAFSPVTLADGTEAFFGIERISNYAGAANYLVTYTIPDSAGRGLKTKASLFTIVGGTCTEVCSSVLSFVNP